MKRQIRYNTFETNSSNINTLTIMTKDEYEDYMKKWDDPNWVWDRYDDCWVNVTDKGEGNKYRYSPNPCENEWNYFDIETATYTTEHGDEIVAVSIYGYGG